MEWGPRAGDWSPENCDVCTKFPLSCIVRGWGDQDGGGSGGSVDAWWGYGNHRLRHDPQGTF